MMQVPAGGSLQPRWLFRQIMALMPGELLPSDLAGLLRPGGHDSLLNLRRSAMIVNRVRLVAFLFAVLTPLWSLVDFLFFPYPLWFALAAMRLLASVAFAFVVAVCRPGRGMLQAYFALALLFSIPTVFYLGTDAVLANYELEGVSGAVRAGYAFLPFILLAGLAVFPLTVAEHLALAGPILLAQALSLFLSGPMPDWYAAGGTFWLLLLIAGVSALAGLSQLAFLVMLVRQAVRDPLTGALSRLSGQEILGLLFDQARRSRAPLSVAFIDLDHFKRINDSHGHPAGDEVLTMTVRAIASRMRRSDVLARWGGEEFLLAMPGTDLKHAQLALARLRHGGLGLRPDGRPVTASVGLAEYSGEGPGDWQGLVETADRRMYAAKQSGRDRIVAEDGLLEPA